jgi:hypothetical protein
MTVIVYKSTDASAPSLSGTAGALIGVLDAVLVNGYGAKAAAGWAKAYSGTNLAAYRPPAGGNRFYLMCDDSGTTNARGVGYETMSAISTGTGDFPTAAQFSGGLYWNKSTTVDATARAWVIAATDRLLIMHVSTAGTANATDGTMYVFGDIKSYKSGDAYATIHIAGNSASPTVSNTASSITSTTAASSGHYAARSYTQLGTSLQFGKHSDAAKAQGTTTAMGSDGLTYPNGPDGGLYLAPLWVHESAGPHLRGTIPGLWNPLHNKPLQHLDTFSGTGLLAGKTFLALKMYASAEAFLETSDTWDV